VEILELISVIPGLVEALLHVCWAVWWLVRGLGRGCLWLVDRVRRRDRDRDFPVVTVVRAGLVGQRGVRPGRPG
jgi:hypothetical protein